MTLKEFQDDLRERIKLANGISARCLREKHITQYNVWWGKAEGYRLALRLSKTINRVEVIV